MKFGFYAVAALLLLTSQSEAQYKRRTGPTEAPYESLIYQAGKLQTSDSKKSLGATQNNFNNIQRQNTTRCVKGRGC